MTHAVRDWNLAGRLLRKRQRLLCSTVQYCGDPLLRILQVSRSELRTLHSAVRRYYMRGFKTYDRLFLPKFVQRPSAFAKGPLLAELC